MKKSWYKTKWGIGIIVSVILAIVGVVFQRGSNIISSAEINTATIGNINAPSIITTGQVGNNTINVTSTNPIQRHITDDMKNEINSGFSKDIKEVFVEFNQRNEESNTFANEVIKYLKEMGMAVEIYDTDIILDLSITNSLKYSIHTQSPYGIVIGNQ